MASPESWAEKAANIREEITKTLGDESMTVAEKKERIEKLEADAVEVKSNLEIHAKAKEMRDGLGPVDSDAGEDAPRPVQLECRNLAAARRDLAMQLVQSKGHGDLVEQLGGRHGMEHSRKRFDMDFELSLKDSTAASNLMGESFYGTGSPAAPSGLFYPGAFGPGIVPNFLPGVVAQRLYPLMIADLIPSFATDSPVLTYITESTAVFNAAATAEGATYPYSSEEFSRIQENVGKIANAAKVTDEVVRDTPQLFSFLQGRVLDGVQRQEEVQLLAGSGGANGGVNGLLNRSAGFTQGTAGLTAATNVVFPAANTPGAGASSATIATLNYGRATGASPTGVTIAETVYQSIVDIQLATFYTPNAIIMNPKDFETVRLAKDNEGQYFGGSFFGADYGYQANASAGQQKLWNTNVVATPAMPAGNVLVGFFDASTIQAARREGITVQMSNQNVDNFEKGEVTIRAEERLGLMCYRPSAFELIALNAG